MKKICRSVLLLALTCSAFAIPNSERVLGSGARVTTLPNLVYRVTYTYFRLIDGWAYDPTESPSSDYFLILGGRETAYGLAGTSGNAETFFNSEGFQWATDSAYFSVYFATALPDRWDGN